LKNFLCRNPQISVRTPEGFLLSRVRGFTPESVTQFFEIYEPAMDTIKHNPARLYSCDKTSITIVWHKHTKILGLKGKRQSSIRRMGIPCDSHQLCESNWTLHSSVTGIFKKKYEARTDEWHTAWINPRMPSLMVDTERDFFPVVSSFHQTYKADKRRTCYLSIGWAVFTHHEPEGHYIRSRESC